MHRRAPAIDARLGPSPFGAEHSGRSATPGTGDTRYAPAILREAQAKHEARSSAVESRKYAVRLDYISKYTSASRYSDVFCCRLWLRDRR
jgi:hypothetical protein